MSLFSLVGIPPLIGFVGKLTLFLATIDAGYAWPAMLAVANTVVSLFYDLRVVACAWCARADDESHVLGRWTALATGAGTTLVGLGGNAGEPLAAVFGRIRPHSAEQHCCIDRACRNSNR